MLRRGVLRDVPAWAAALAAAGAAGGAAGGAAAQTATDTLRIVVDAGQNSVDPHGPGVNQAALGVAWMVYDRLVGFGVTTLPEGGLSYDFSRIVPELAERWAVAADGLSITFLLREGAVFHDGSTVTAGDVAWSLDRAAANPGRDARQADGLAGARRFVAVDDRTVRVELAARNALSLADLAMVRPSVLNGALCRRHATAADPWALLWVRTNAAGGGAYRVETWTPRTETVLVRHEGWRSGALPGFRRVVIRESASTGNRRAMLLRGEADVATAMPVHEVAALAQEPTLAAPGMPLSDTVYHVGMNTRQPPFDDVRVRQAVAAAVPYRAILDGALLGRGRALWGAAPGPVGPAWPQAFPYRTDMDQARALLKAAGLESGFETTLSYDLATASADETVALLIQDALKALNVSVTIDRRPAGTLRALTEQRALAFYLAEFGAWVDRAEQAFALLYAAGPSNGAGYANAEMDRLIRAAQGGIDGGARDEARRQMIGLAIRDAPYVPLVQPCLNVVAQRSVKGFVTMFHRQVDARVLTRG